MHGVFCKTDKLPTEISESIHIFDTKAMAIEWMVKTIKTYAAESDPLCKEYKSDDDEEVIYHFQFNLDLVDYFQDFEVIDHRVDAGKNQEEPEEY